MTRRLDALLAGVALRGLEPRGAAPAEARAPVDRAPRHALATWARLHHGGRSTRAYTANASETGVLLAAVGSPLAGVGDRVELELLGEHAPEAPLSGRVVREVDGPVFLQQAVVFDALDDAGRAALRRLLPQD